MNGKKRNLHVQEQISISIISDITLEPHIGRAMQSQFAVLASRILVYDISIYDYMEKENIKKMCNSDICVLWMNYEKYIEECKTQSYIKKRLDLLEKIEMICQNIHNITTAKIVLISLEDYYEKLSVCIGNIIVGSNNVDLINQSIVTHIGIENTIIDLKKIIAELGIANSYDLKGKYRWDSPYSNNLIQKVTYEIVKAYRIFRGISKKCIVLDCDNVLWGGLISEDGIENIRLGGMKGKAYKEFQTFLLQLYDLGVILTVCSKNDLNDVKLVFQSHPEMVLTEEHIAMFTVNWDNKASNIQQISETLNIGLEHMVFIDDSLLEINEVQNILPQVQSILFDPKTVYKQLETFNLSLYNNREEIKLRNLTYKTNVNREQLKQCYKNYSDYLDALDMKIEFLEDNNIFRIAELSQRTNKFTNGKRYDINSLTLKIREKNYDIYSVYLSDKYSVIGLVGAIGIHHVNGIEVLDLFCLSCRALGRNVEKRMVEFIKSKYSIANYYFSSTNKNSNVKRLLQENF